MHDNNPLLLTAPAAAILCGTTLRRLERGRKNPAGYSHWAKSVLEARGIESVGHLPAAHLCHLGDHAG